MINWILAILVEKHVMKIDEAKELATILDSMTYSHTFQDAYNDIKKVLKEIEE